MIFFFNQITPNPAALQAWISKGSLTWPFLNAPKLARRAPVKAPLSEPQLQETSNKSVSSISLYSATVSHRIKTRLWLGVSFIRSAWLRVAGEAPKAGALRLYWYAPIRSAAWGGAGRRKALNKQWTELFPNLHYVATPATINENTLQGPL